MELMVYTSDAAPGVDGSDVFGIVAVSARNNVNAGLTGVLFYKDARFLQILEGPKDQLDLLLQRLKQDSRHTNLKVVGRIPLSARRFPEWNMKRVFNLNADDEADKVRSKMHEHQLGDDFEAELDGFFDGSSKRAA